MNFTIVKKSDQIEKKKGVTMRPLSSRGRGKITEGYRHGRPSTGGYGPRGYGWPIALGHAQMDTVSTGTGTWARAEPARAQSLFPTGD